MRVLLSTFGSRGDVQPFVALAIALQSAGIDAIVCAPPDAELADLLDRSAVPFVPAFSSVRQWVDTARALRLTLPELAARMIDAHYKTVAAVTECDAILATGLFPSVAAAQMSAEQRGVPFVFVALYPFLLPSPFHPPLAYPGWPNPPELTDNIDLWAYNAEAMTALFGAAVNAGRAANGLAQLTNVRDHVFTSNPWVASDPTLSPWQHTEMTDAIQTGGWTLPDKRPLPPELEAFLSSGEPPIYIGFGSMRLASPEDVAMAAIRAARANDRRVILARGWAGLKPIDDDKDCISIGEVNHSALFGRVAAVVHHGGAGTTTTAASCGAPQVIVPQSADQPYWAARVAQLGIGVGHPGPVTSAESLSAALATVLRAEIRDRAGQVSHAIRHDGAEIAAGLLTEMTKAISD